MGLHTEKKTVYKIREVYYESEPCGRGGGCRQGRDYYNKNPIKIATYNSCFYDTRASDYFKRNENIRSYFSGQI